MDKSIGNRIKKKRTELKITQMQVYEKTGISSGHLSCIENGKYLPSAQAILALSELLDCSTDWILKGESSISKIDDIILERERVMLDGFRQLPPEDRDEILEILAMKLRKVKGDTQKLEKLYNSGIEENNMVG